MSDTNSTVTFVKVVSSFFEQHYDLLFITIVIVFILFKSWSWFVVLGKAIKNHWQISTIIGIVLFFSNHLSSVLNNPMSLLISIFLLVILVEAWIEFLLQEARKSSESSKSIGYYNAVIDLLPLFEKKLYYVAEFVDLLKYFAQALVELGELHYGRQESDKAYERFDEVINKFGKSYKESVRVSIARAHVDRGIVKELLGKADEACEDYSVVITDYSSVTLQVARAYLNRGTWYIRKGDYEKAEVDYQKLIGIREYDKCRNEELLKLVAMSLYNKGKKLINCDEDKINEYDKAVGICDCNTGKDTDIQINKFLGKGIDDREYLYYWEGKPISLYEIVVNALVEKGKIYVDQDKYKEAFLVIDDIVKRVREKKHGKVDKYLLSLLNDLVDKAYKAILGSFIDKAEAIQECDDSVKVCEDVIDYLNNKKSENELLCREETAVGLVNEACKKIYKAFYLESELDKKPEKYVEACNNCIEVLESIIKELKFNNKGVVTVLVNTFQLKRQQLEKSGKYDEVISTCDDALKVIKEKEPEQQVAFCRDFLNVLL